MDTETLKTAMELQKQIDLCSEVIKAYDSFDCGQASDSLGDRYEFSPRVRVGKIIGGVKYDINLDGLIEPAWIMRIVSAKKELLEKQLAEL